MSIMCIGYRSAKIPIEALVHCIHNMDTDKDGCISVGECIDAIKELARKLKVR